ncbi:MAG: hypothetical protein ACO3NK_00245 [Prochlorotrichaceae cyanobacterium]|jgi:hypothetical protein
MPALNWVNLPMAAVNLSPGSHVLIDDVTQIATAIPKLVQDAIARGSSTMLRDLRHQINTGDWDQ